MFFFIQNAYLNMNGRIIVVQTATRYHKNKNFIIMLFKYYTPLGTNNIDIILYKLY